MKSIRNSLAYFYTVIKNWDLKEKIKQSEIEKHEISLELFLEENIKGGFDFEKILLEKSFLGWIELIENDNLYEALKELPIEDQIFISYIFKECKTQRELAELYCLDQSVISRKFKIITRILKENCIKSRI